jgi:hypothetical protein
LSFSYIYLETYKMTEKNLVEETLIQIQNLENVINENAKEILHSTMKEEISELVKESLNEADEDEDETLDVTVTSDDDELDIDVDDENDSIEDFSDIDIEDGSDMGMPQDDLMGMGDFDDDDDFSDETIDLTDASDEEVLKVFKAMSADDEITVTQDGDYIHLNDDSEDVEYLIQTESEEDELEESWSEDLEESEEIDSYEEMDESDNEMEETIYEIALSDDENMEEPKESKFIPKHKMEEETDEEFEEYTLEESAKGKSIKPKVGKGAKVGSPKFSYKTQKGGFKENMKQGTKGVGMGKAKFEFNEGEVFEMPSRTGIKLSKEEAKEAARTYGTGWRKGALPKGARAGQEQARLRTESVNGELDMLRTKNEEYRKALNLFRDKLNEVAVFNSNLAYATRLFTEHSTSKQEKINILRRFDSAESIKESKALYKTIKEELSGSFVGNNITESIERVIEKEQSSGSAVNLIESKTYENPQFLRMKDIMAKIVK